MSGRPGVLLGVDVGQARVGLAAGDALGLLAHPVATLTRDEGGGADLETIAAEVRQRGAVGVVVGLPRVLSGGEGLAAERARGYALALQRAVQVPLWLRDERLTTVDAHRALHQSGVRGRDHRQVVDQTAAVMILQGALDAVRAGHLPGTPLQTKKPRTRTSGTRREGTTHAS